MNRSILLAAALLLALTTTVSAQNALLFENAKEKETVTVEQGDYVHLEFKGYLGQSQGRMEHVLSLTEQSVFVNNQGMLDGASQYEIKLQDITGFRRMPTLQPIVKPLANAGLVLTTYFVLDSDDRFTNNQVFLYSAAMGVVANYLVDFLFPDDIEFKVSDGWTIRFAPGTH